ncbi:adhesin, partial [Moraxella catarrhalis]|nr:adhesin [Moraxella catarrhalis]
MIGATLSGSAYAKGDYAVQVADPINGLGSAQATKEASVAIGSLSKALGSQSIAIGGGKPNRNQPQDNNKVGPHAIGDESIAIGGDVTAQGDASIAIGSDDLYLQKIKDLSDQGQTPYTKIQEALEGHVELTKIQRDPKLHFRRTFAQGHASTAVGTMAQAVGHFSNAFGTRATAKGNFSLAVGLLANAEQGYAIAIGSNAQAKSYNSLALGVDTKVELGRGIALGYKSQINAGNHNNEVNQTYKPEGETLSTGAEVTKNGDQYDILSIGNNDLRRRIINVGAGSQDTDAVNVAQLKAVVSWAEKRKITFRGDDNSTGIERKLGEILTIKGGADTRELTDKNIGVVKDNGNGGGLQVKLAKNL